jgi:hypothetical protein
MPHMMTFYVDKTPGREDADAVMKVLRERGLEPSFVSTLPARRDEQIQYRRRKRHYTDGKGGWICNTKHVSKRYVLQDPEKVTCELCKKLMHKPYVRIDCDDKSMNRSGMFHDE